MTIMPPLRQNNGAMTFGIIMTLLLRHLYVAIYIYNGKYIGSLTMIMLFTQCIANALSPQLMVWYRQMLYHL